MIYTEYYEKQQGKGSYKMSELKVGDKCQAVGEWEGACWNNSKNRWDTTFKSVWNSERIYTVVSIDSGTEFPYICISRGPENSNEIRLISFKRENLLQVVKPLEFGGLPIVMNGTHKVLVGGGQDACYIAIDDMIRLGMKIKRLEEITNSVGLTITIVTPQSGAGLSIVKIGCAKDSVENFRECLEWAKAERARLCKE